MLKWNHRLSPAMVVACLALIVALGGTGVAAVSQLVPRNSVGTVQLRSNAVVSAKVRNRSLLAVDFKRGQIPAGPAGPTGPAGPAGAAGPAGPAGPAGTVTRLTAVVSAAGAIVRSQGTTSMNHPSTGTFEVGFNQDVTACTYVAALGSTSGSPLPVGQVAVGTVGTNGVLVRTRDSAGALMDHPFHVIVVC